jgi:hypothetical protein
MADKADKLVLELVIKHDRPFNVCALTNVLKDNRYTQWKVIVPSKSKQLMYRMYGKLLHCSGANGCRPPGHTRGEEGASTAFDGQFSHLRKATGQGEPVLLDVPWYWTVGEWLVPAGVR